MHQATKNLFVCDYENRRILRLDLGADFGASTSAVEVFLVLEFRPGTISRHENHLLITPSSSDQFGRSSTRLELYDIISRQLLKVVPLNSLFVETLHTVETGRGSVIVCQRGPQSSKVIAKLNILSLEYLMAYLKTIRPVDRF